ncbi:MarR family transcriptional regulator [Mycolicibacterium moriokaense]|nr:MarR family transcriptional regulator [Mycolicibacterium moriokaense]
MDVFDADRSVGYLVKRVQQSLRRQCDAALRPTELSMAQYSAMRALEDHPEASASELARQCFVTRQSLQDLLAGLRSAGLVRDAKLPPRGRARSLELTPTGRKRLANAHAVVIAVESRMLEGVSAADQRQLSDWLGRCAGNLEQD